MKIWAIVKYTLLSNIRDRKSIISYLLFPVILIIILGNALSGAFGAADIGEVKVGIVIDEKTDFSKSLTDYFNREIDFVDTLEYKTVEEAKQAIEEEEISVAIEVTKELENNIADGNIGKVYLWTSNEGNYQTTVVKTLMDVCMDATNTILALREHDYDSVIFELKDTVEDKGLSLKGNRAGSMDYYAVTIMVMALMYGSAIAAREFEMNLKGEMGKRLRSTPTGIIQILIAKIISCIAIVFIQGMIIVLISKYMFGANWGDSMLKIMAYVAIGAALSSEIGIMVCILVNNPEKVGGVLSILVPAMTLISGGFVKTSFGGLEQIVPNYQLQNLFFKTIYGGNNQSITISLIYIIGLIVGMLCISVIVGRRKRVW